MLGFDNRAYVRTAQLSTGLIAVIIIPIPDHSHCLARHPRSRYSVVTGDTCHIRNFAIDRLFDFSIYLILFFRWAPPGSSPGRFIFGLRVDWREL